MNSFVLSCFLTAVSTIMLGLFVFLQNPKDRVNHAWFFTTVAIFLWTTGLGGVGISGDKEHALFWQRILYIGTILIPIFFFNFCIIFLKRNGKTKILSTIGHILSIFFIFLLFTKLFIIRIAERTNFNYWPVETGSFYWLFLIYFLFYMTYAIFLLKIDSKKYSSITREQINFIYYAALIGFAGGSTNFLLDFNLNIFPFGNYFVILYVVFITYAIFKHHLFNIKVIATELLTFAIWIFLLMRTLLAETLREGMLNGTLLILIILFGILLIKSVIKEVEHREKLEVLTKELRATNEKLRYLDKVKSEFLSFASHQVKAPMAIVKGFAQLIYDGTYGQVSEKIKETAKKIKNSADKMIALVENLLDLRKIEEGKMEYNFTETDVVKLAKDAVEALRPMAQDKKLDLTFEGPANEIKIQVDSMKFSQVIQNFIDNAIKYTDQGWIKVKVEEKENSVLISVSDSGRGISPELRPRLFEQFSRDSAIAKEIQGTGLGLYIAKQIVETHHGIIWAESEGEGKGAVFCVEIPNK